jgi:hypothetical protein
LCYQRSVHWASPVATHADASVSIPAFIAGTLQRSVSNKTIKIY